MLSARWFRSAEVIDLEIQSGITRSATPIGEMRKYREQLMFDSSSMMDAPWYFVFAPSGWTLQVRLDGLEKTYVQYEFAGNIKHGYWHKGQENIFLDFINLTK